MTNVHLLVEVHPCRVLFEESLDETKTPAMSGFVSDRCFLSDCLMNGEFMSHRSDLTLIFLSSTFM
jgi:hypothetical protein